MLIRESTYLLEENHVASICNTVPQPKVTSVGLDWENHAAEPLSPVEGPWRKEDLALGTATVLYEPRHFCSATMLGSKDAFKHLSSTAPMLKRRPSARSRSPFFFSRS